MPYQAPLYRLQGKTRHSAPAAYLNACHEIHKTVNICTSWHGKASRGMKSGHEIHEMPDPCTLWQFDPDAPFDMWQMICGWHHHRNMRPPVITARRCGELARVGLSSLPSVACCPRNTQNSQYMYFVAWKSITSHEIRSRST